MTQDSFTYNITARCEAQKAIRLLSEFNQHSDLHPLIMHVERVEAPQGVLRRYLITDQLKWGPFAFKIRYRADILRVTDDEILTEAFQSPNTTVTNQTTLTQHGDELHIQVKITMQAPSLLFGYAFHQAQTAHLEMARRIEKALTV
ncbi:MAG: hypothetical protein CVU44_20515 [Chloroflexi bacterium HGW-Chloroflexi-6]|nr:MAG: hypothetical protein CVU44_20515 [Chloroflexi bacterium HGW-Chloroflexi-6]